MVYEPRYDELIARTYDAVYAKIRDPSGDVGFYTGLAKESVGPVLELGCGTGRVLLSIAREGIPCTGLDASEAMLRVLREKGPPPNVTLVSGDMRAFDLGRRFPLVTMPFRALSHLTEVTDQLECLATIRRHLAPGGVFAFDVFDPRLDLLARTSEPEALGATFEHEGHVMERWEQVERDATRQVLRVRFRFAGGPPALTGETSIEMRWFYRYELEHLLARAGFTDLAFFGGFDRRPWSAGGETVALART